MNFELRSWYGFVLQQMAAEVYLEDVNLTSDADVKRALRRGNNRPGFEQTRGLTRFTDGQADEFLKRFQIIAQASDDPTIPRTGLVNYLGTNVLANTGLSATLMQQRGTNAFTLSIRSTEYQPWSNGGDRERDGFGADLAVLGQGFALAQIDALEKYYYFLRSTINTESGEFYLPAGATLNVTGYSLGGHLATVFTELHADEISHTYTFNALGRGIWDRTQGELRAMIDYYRSVLADSDYAGTPSPEEATRYALYGAAKRAVGPLDALNIYKDPRYKWAVEETQRQFRSVGVISPALIFADPNRTDLSNGAAGKITQLYGKEIPGDSQGAANSGVHGPATGIFVEAQPFLEGWPEFLGGAADFGNGHALVLIADSLALMRVYQQLAPDLSLDTLNRIFSAASNKRAISNFLGNSSFEEDALENALDPLRRLFLGEDIKPTSYVPGARGFGDLTARNGFYDNLNELVTSTLFSAVAGRVRIVDVSGKLAIDIRAAAENDIAYRYALKELNPFAVLDPQDTGLYRKLEGRLALYGALTTPEGLTPTYLEDRATFFERKFYVTALNLDKFYRDPVTSDPTVLYNAPDERGKEYQREAKDFQDRASGFITASSGDNPNSLQHFIFGSAKADFIEGAGRQDHLYGGAGGDVLIGGKADDYLEGGTGFDTYQFRSGDGRDTVLDADGKGILIRDSKAILLAIKQTDSQWSFGSTNFSLAASGSDLDITFAGAGDVLTLKDFDFAKAQTANYDGIRLVNAPVVPTNPTRIYIGDTQPDKKDTFTGTVSNESFLTGAGDDVVYADGSASTTSTMGGDDLIEAGADRDTVAAGGGNDWVEGGSQGDILAGNAGDDILYGDTSVGQTLTLDAAISAGDTALTDAGAADLVSGDAGDDVLIGGGTSDFLLGGTGNDVIVGGGGDDNLYGDGALDVATLDWTVTRTVLQGGAIFKVSLTNAEITGNDAAGGMDIIYGGAGDDWAFGGFGDDYVEGGSGKDALFGEQGSDVLFGGSGDDVLVGDNLVSGGIASAGDDYLDGGAGNDLLQGDSGDDILVGGSGDDVLVGGPGKDTYVFNAGDGRDQIFDDSTGAEGSVLVFGEGFDPNTVTIRPGSMVLDFGDAGSVELASFNHFDPNAPAAFESLVFADGTIFSFQDVLDRGFTITGTEADDNGHDAAHPVLVGTAFKDHVWGLGGNDVIAGLQGDDVLDGGAGADQLQGGEGNDTLLGGEGDDALFGMTGDDYLDGGAGRDWLLGGPGNDTYAYGAGDTAYDIDGQTTIAFGPGISVSDVVLRRQATAFQGQSVFSISLKGDLTSFEQTHGAFPEHSLGITLASDDRLGAFIFADGTTLDHAELLRETWIDQAHLVGGAGSDTLEGYAGNDFLQGGDGDDVLRGFGGDDRIESGSGHDTLDGGKGADLLLGGAGADTLIGGSGNDTLAGGEAGDLYLYARGDGDDVISEAGDAASTDVLRFTDIASTEVALARQASGDLLATVASGGSVTISGYYNAVTNKIERIEFADSVTVVSSALDLLTVPPVTGTSGDDILVGTPYADTLVGAAGNDVLDGGGGNDRLLGGSGADTYRLRLGGGADTVVEDGADPSIVQLDTGTAFANLTTARSGDDLVLTVKNGNASDVLTGYYRGQTNWTIRTDAGEEKSIPQLVEYLDSIRPPSTPAEVQTLYLDDARQKYGAVLAHEGKTGGIIIIEQPFSDVAVIYRDTSIDESGSGNVRYLNLSHIVAGGSANLLDLGFTWSVIADAGAGDDLIVNTGQSFSYTLSTVNDLSIGSFLYGGDGNDTIFGSYSNDWILGGNGNDYLAGSQGNDTYVVLSTESGTKIIDEVNEHAVVGRFGDNQGARYSTDTLLFADVPYSDVSFNIGSYDSTPTSDPGYGQIFATLDMTWGEGKAVRLLLPDPNNRYLWQFPGESYGVETIKFSDGITLRQGEILPYVSAPTTGAAGADATIYGTADNDYLSVVYPQDLYQRTALYGFAGNDALSGGSQNDVIDGGDGNDFLTGAGGDDVLIGGAGHDNIDAGQGNDALDGGSGNDVLNGGPGNDTYLFAPGFGRDVIYDYTPLRLNTNVIRFEDGIAPAQIGVTRDYRSLLLVDLDTADHIEISFAGPGGYEGWGVSRVEFADGTTWSPADLLARAGPVPPTPSDDVIGGTDGADTLQGLGGNDALMGFAADDVLIGGEGDDFLEGDAGDDILQGDEGNDFLEGDAGYDILRGGAGSDDIEEWDSGNNLMQGGAGNDYLYEEGHSLVIGGAGDDWIDNYGANAVIAFNRGDGADTVYAADTLTLSLGGGIAEGGLDLSEDGTDLVLRGGDDLIRLCRQYESEPRAWPAMHLQIVGDQVRMYDLTAVVNAFYARQAGDATLHMALGEVLPGYQIDASYDRAFGGDLAVLYARGKLDESIGREAILAVLQDDAFGASPQSISERFAPRIVGISGNEVLIGTSGGESISGGDGTDWIDAGAGDDVLTGGPGNDLLFGGAGADTFVYNLGDGTDVLFDQSGPNTVVFGSGIDPSALSLDLGSLFLHVGTAGGIHFESFDPANPYGPRDVDQFIFADGSRLTYEALIGRGFDLYGTEGADTITGTAAADRIRGGHGNDILAGGRGGDTYLYNAGDGRDTIAERNDPGSIDVLQFGAGIDVFSVHAARSEEDLVITFPTGADSVTLRGWYAIDGPGIERVSFADGMTWDDGYLQSLVQTNRPPVLAAPIGDRRTNEDERFTFTVPADSFSDPDSGDRLSYFASLAIESVLPAWLSFDSETQTFSGTPRQADVGTIDLRIRATDTGGLSADQAFGLTVTNINDAPLLATAIADQVATEDSPFTFVVPTGTYSDEDPGDSLFYQASLADGSPLPGWLAFDAITRQFSGTPSNQDVGGIDVRVAVSDGADLSASDVFAIAVANVNDAPTVANAIHDQSALEDAVFAFVIPRNTFADVDVGDELSYMASRADGSAVPQWLGFDSYARTLSGTPGNSDVGSYELRFTATDSAGASVHEDFLLTVANVNDAPVRAAPIADQTVLQDALFSLELPSNTFVDEDAGDSLSWYASRPDGTALPAWLRFDPKSRALSGTPGNADVGAVDIQVTATDAAGLSAASIFHLTVVNVNDAPRLQTALVDKSATEDKPFVLAVPLNTFADVDVGDSLTLAARLSDGSSLPQWLSFNAADGRFSGIPANADVGSHNIRLTATDAAGASASDDFALTVENVNDAPVVAHPLAMRAFEAGLQFSFAVPTDTFVDEDRGDVLKLNAKLDSGGPFPVWLKFDPSLATFTGNPASKVNGISHIVVTATDVGGLSVSSDFGLVIYAKTGATVKGDARENVLYGGTGDETIEAKGANDVVFAGAGNDTLKGGSGNDLLQGGEGKDVLRGGDGRDLLDGGTGGDEIVAGKGSDIIAGGQGNDTVHTSTGADVILFNRGDGSDTLIADRAGDNTLSLGGGIRYADLSLAKSGKDLVVGTGGDDRMVLKDWYGGKRSILNLQVILDASRDFDAESVDPLRNRKVETFDFAGLVGAFDRARAVSPGLTSWALTNALLQFHIAGRDDAAIGGDLAYWYGNKGSFAGMSIAAAQQVIGATGFGSDAQSLRPFSGLQDGFIKLS